MIDPPSISRMALSFFKSAAVFVAAGMPRASVEEIEQRLSTCNACPSFDKDGYGGSGQCRVCGCNMEVKTVMATEACPEGKWQKINPEKEDK
jgi:hypothetical protein